LINGGGGRGFDVVIKILELFNEGIFFPRIFKTKVKRCYRFVNETFFFVNCDMFE